MRSSAGKILISREILNDIEKFHGLSARLLFLFLYINANFSKASKAIKFGKEALFLEMGEILTSHKEMAKATKSTQNYNRDTLAKLVRANLVTTRSKPNCGIVVKINDYSTLAGFDVEKNTNKLSSSPQNLHSKEPHYTPRHKNKGIIKEEYNICRLETTKTKKKATQKNEKFEQEFSELTDYWNAELCPPFAKVEVASSKRISMFKAIRKKYSVQDIKLVADDMATWRFSNTDVFVATIEMLLRSTKFDEKFEKAKAKKQIKDQREYVRSGRDLDDFFTPAIEKMNQRGPDV